MSDRREIVPGNTGPRDPEPRGSPAAEMERAQAALEADDFEAALRILLPLLRERLLAAISLLGVLRMLALGRPRNIHLARRLLSLAARRGDLVALHNLGTLFSGIGEPDIARDDARALELHRAAAAAGLEVGSPEYLQLPPSRR